MDLDDELYPAKYNKPHSFSAVLNYQYSDKYSIGLSCIYGSNATYTAVLGKTYATGIGNYGSLSNPYSSCQNISGIRNGEHYDTYFRLDLSLSRKTNLFGMDGDLKFQFINLSNHFNELLYIWDHKNSPSKVRAYGMFPIIFTFGWDFKF